MFDRVVTFRSRTFINETNFDDHPLDKHAPGETLFKEWTNRYIAYRYEPACEEFDEERYFTPDFD